MKYQPQSTVPVYATRGEPIMPCHPKRARKLMERGRAVPHHVRGIFGIRLLDKTRDECEVQEVVLRIDPGANVSGFAITTDDDTKRAVIGAYEFKHRARDIRATLHKRKNHRRNRRYRLRYRQQRSDNRRRKPNTLVPSIDSIRMDTHRLVCILRQVYPIASMSIEQNKFDAQLMRNPNIRGVEYRHGTLFGWHVRAYIFDRDGHQCVYCGNMNTKFELDHIRPRSHGSDRVDNLVVSCRDCNNRKGNQPIDEFLSDRPELLANITKRVNESDLTSAAHVGSALPFIIRDLQALDIPLYTTDAATVAWNRRRFGVPKTHCYDAALHGLSFSSISTLPMFMLQIMPSNGRSKQKSTVDRHGTPAGKPFRDQQRLPKRLRRRDPAAGHRPRRQRYDPQGVATGDIVQLEYKDNAYYGRVVVARQGRGAYISGSKPQIGAPMAKCQLVARNPRHIIQRVLIRFQGE